MVIPNAAGVDRVARDRDEVVELITRMVQAQVPGWAATSPADLGITLIELLASAADRLAYQQDAVATEAYIGTARRRTSIVRHARLLDVAVDEGCNARTWLHLEAADGATVSVPRGTVVFTSVYGFEACVCEPPPDGQAVVFETMQPAIITASHNTFVLAAPLPEGATQATLRGRYDGLASGDVVCLGTVPGQVVRLIAPPQLSVDPSTDEAITTITWGIDDALMRSVIDLTVLGNMVLADHGLTSHGHEVARSPGRSGWRVGAADLTVAEPLSTDALVVAPARRSLVQDPAGAVAAIVLIDTSDPLGVPWRPTRDVLACHPLAHRFVVEPDEQGWGHLRFGDGAAGRAVPAGTQFSATLRRGAGRAGNIAAGAIGHIVWETHEIVSVTNVCAGVGGADAESTESLRLRAPQSWRRRRVYVTPADYAEAAGRFGGVADAWARWNTDGAIEVFISVRPSASALGLVAPLAVWLGRRSVVGQTVLVHPAVDVPLVVELTAVPNPGVDAVFVPAAVQRVLRESGLFAPGRFRIGEAVYASAIVGSTSGVAGIAAVDITRLVRQDGRGVGRSVDASISIEPWEVARIDPALVRVTAEPR